MKINAIRNCGTTCPAPQKSKIQTAKYQTNLLDNEPKPDTVAFKGRVAKGAGIGAIIGVGALGVLSILSGGAAAPAAFAAYAATFGTAGGMVGNALDKIDKEDKENKNNK